MLYNTFFILADAERCFCFEPKIGQNEKVVHLSNKFLDKP